MKSRTIDNEEIEKLSFGNEKINIEIPKFTNALMFYIFLSLSLTVFVFVLFSFVSTPFLYLFMMVL